MQFILRFIGGLFGSLAERLFVFFMALFMSQAPQYMNLYLNVLSGAKAAYEKSVKEIGEKAAEIGMTTKDFIDDLVKSPSQAAHKSGELHQSQIKHFEDAKAAFDAIKNASAITRPFIFLKHVDWSLAKNVQFQAALPFTLESLIYVIMGIILGMLLYRALLYFPKKLLGKGNKELGA
ncbi:MAG: DUF2937 family protein [Spirochaetes bacterium]|nr:DUF2937 family protein [Spirochaetota bacterium]